jgi:hypothetical protein
VQLFGTGIVGFAGAKLRKKRNNNQNRRTKRLRIDALKAARVSAPALCVNIKKQQMKFYNSKLDKLNSLPQFYFAVLNCVVLLLWLAFKYFFSPDYQPELVIFFFSMSSFVLISLSFLVIRLRLYALNLWICGLLILILTSKLIYEAVGSPNVWLSILCLIMVPLAAWLYWGIFAYRSYCIIKTARKLKF